MSDFSWENLIVRIEDGDVVPIIGQDVLQVEIGPENEKKKVMLYAHLAQQLAAKLNVHIDPKDPNPLNAAAAAYLENDSEHQLDDVDLALKTLVKQTSELPIPESLRKLAEIRRLNLFLTTTFDPMMKRALDDVRFGGAPGTQSLSLTAAKSDDVTKQMLDSGVPIVFHLFGRAAMGDYAVTEEDTLEWVHSLPSRQPPVLFDALEEKFLLLIGNKFDDWLARFFIRGAKRDRVWIARRGDYVVEDRLHEENAFFAFLRRLRMKIFTTGGPIEFIDTLHELWMKTHADEEGDARPRMGMPVTPKPGYVFISYADEDRPLAKTVRERLYDNGFNVWLDDRLTGGDLFGPRIANAIDESVVFMPIISKHSLTDRPRYFREEWRHALEVERKMNEELAFIMPVMIDEVSYAEPKLPERFHHISWETLNDEFPRTEFKLKLQETVRRRINARRLAS